MNHVRVIVTETGSGVTVERVIQGESKKNVERRTRQQLQSIIEQVLRDSPQAYCDDIAEALRHGYWWTDLGSEEFTVMVLEPQHVDRAEPLVVEIDLEGGMISHAKTPPNVQVNVRDFDTNGVDADRLHQDDEGRAYVKSAWESGRRVEDDDSLTKLHDHLHGDAFIILVQNPANGAESQFEAWAYRGPLDFDHAAPIRFGLGADPVQALTALNTQLGMPSA